MFWDLFEGFRRIVVFGLGVFIILDALIDDKDKLIPELIIGMIMVGILPVENVISSFRFIRSGKNRDA